MNRPLYDTLVPYYEVLEGRDWKAEIDLIASLLEHYHCTSLIDLGCGTGRHVIELARKGFDATGIDLSRKNVAFARKRAKDEHVKSTFVEGSYFTYSPQKRFDAALCLNWSIPVRDEEIAKFLKNTSSLLVEGGLLIFDYEKTSQIAWDVVGEPVFDSWKVEGESLVRVSVGHVNDVVLASTDVYMLFPRLTETESPTEVVRYQPPGSQKRPQIFVDNSYVRFFSPVEISRFARQSGFRRIQNRVLPRGKYRRNYVVLRKNHTP